MLSNENKSAAILVALLCAFPAGAAVPVCDVGEYVNPRPLPAEARFMPGEVIIRAITEAGEYKQAVVPADTGLRKLECLQSTGDCLYSYPSGKDACAISRPESAARALNDDLFACSDKPKDPGAPRAFVFPNAILRLVRDAGPQLMAKNISSELGQQTQLEKMGAARAWLLAVPNAAVKTAILDTGILQSHPDFANDLPEFAFKQFVTGWQIPCARKPCDGRMAFDDPHGTSMAGMIAGARNGKGIVGVAWNTRVLPILSGYGGVLDDKSLALAVECAVNAGVRVINASFGGPDRLEATERKIEQLLNSKAQFMLVASSGNKQQNLNQRPQYPGSMRDSSGQRFPNIIVVMGHDDDGAYDYVSSWGKGAVDIAAPSYSYNATICGRNPCETPSGPGSSNATAYVAGAAALLWSIYPDWNSSAIRWRVLKNGVFEQKLAHLIDPPIKLDLDRIAYPLAFIRGTADRKIRPGHLLDIDDETAFPPSMCTSVDRRVMKLGVDGTQTVVVNGSIMVGSVAAGDTVQILATCHTALEKHLDRAYRAASLPYGVIIG